MDRNKKIFIIILVALAAIVTAFLIYFFFYNSNTGTPSAPTGTFPSTSSSSSSNPPSESGGASNQPSANPPGAWTPVLRQITTVPTAGAVLVDTAASSTVIRYMERAKGNVYETDAVSIKANRLSNTTVPQIYEALWNATGNNVIARFLKGSDTVQTFDAAVAPGAGGQGELQGSFLSSDIKDLVVSPSGNQIFYLINAPSGLAGIAASFDGVRKVQIFSSPISEWLASWPKENTVTVTSKAGSGIPGIMLFIDAGNGGQKTILSGIDGLTTLTNSDLSEVLYSVSSQNSLATDLFNVQNKNSMPLALTTLPEKCVWSRLQKNIVYCAVPETIPASAYPDDWYQGLVSFRDELWKIDATTGNSNFIMNLGDQSRADFDAINLSLNSKENFLLLTNKNDLTLWEVQLAP